MLFKRLNHVIINVDVFLFQLIVQICQQFLEICLDVNEKVQIRLSQIKNHMFYFKRFLK